MIALSGGIMAVTQGIGTIRGGHNSSSSTIVPIVNLASYHNVEIGNLVNKVGDDISKEDIAKFNEQLSSELKKEINKPRN
jgi:hypothetical protein